MNYIINDNKICSLLSFAVLTFHYFEKENYKIIMVMVDSQRKKATK